MPNEMGMQIRFLILTLPDSCYVPIAEFVTHLMCNNQ